MRLTKEAHKITLKNKIAKFIDYAGTAVTVNSKNHRILIRLMSSGEAKTYLDDIEYMGLVKPAYIITFSSDIKENNSFVLEGRTYTVRKITPIFFRNEVIFKSAVIY